MNTCLDGFRIDSRKPPSNAAKYWASARAPAHNSETSRPALLGILIPTTPRVPVRDQKKRKHRRRPLCGFLWRASTGARRTATSGGCHRRRRPLHRRYLSSSPHPANLRPFPFFLVDHLSPNLPCVSRIDFCAASSDRSMAPSFPLDVCLVSHPCRSMSPPHCPLPHLWHSFAADMKP